MNTNYLERIKIKNFQEHFNLCLDTEDIEIFKEYISYNLEYIHSDPDFYSIIFPRLYNYLKHNNLLFIDEAIKLGLDQNKHLINDNSVLSLYLKYSLSKNDDPLPIILLLVSHNADVNVISSNNNDNILHDIIVATNSWNHNSAFEFIKLFVPLMKNPMSKNNDNRNPYEEAKLFLQAFPWSKEILEYLSIQNYLISN